MYKIFSNASKALLERPTIFSASIQAHFGTSVPRSSILSNKNVLYNSPISQNSLGIRYKSDEKGGVVTGIDLKTKSVGVLGVKEEKVVETTEEVEKDVADSVLREYQKTKAKFEILQMDESDLEGTSVGKRDKLPINVIQGHRSSRILNNLQDEKYNRTDIIAFLSQDIDLRRESIQRWWKGLQEKYEIKIQRHAPARHNILGPDLAAAHFFVFRKGKIKFAGQPDWVTEYRTDSVTEEHEEDLPAIKPELCTLPTKYDPEFVVEAVDCSDMTQLRYEGLENLKGLRYCKSLKFENCIHLDSWCIDRLASYFSDRLVYLDISGCTGLTEGALCALARFKNLKTLIVNDLPQIQNKDLVCAWLEDMNPELEIIGTSYEEKLQELQRENERLSKKEHEVAAATVTVESSETSAVHESQTERHRQ